MNYIDIFILVTSFFIGISIGSFINNLGLRIADYINNSTNVVFNLKQELVMFQLGNNPKYSICPICNNRLKIWMNIPVFSWLFLKGKCGFCSTKIPVVYLISELFFGFMFVLITLLNKELSNVILFNLVFTLSYLQILIMFNNTKQVSILFIDLLSLFCVFLFIFEYIYVFKI